MLPALLSSPTASGISWLPLSERVAHLPFSDETRATCWNDAMCWNGANCSFVQAPGFYCGVERDTQRQLWQHMPRDAVVLEIGGRYGTVSCAIAKRQQYSGMRVTVEPDKLAFEKYLQPNVRRNGCAGTQVRGVVERMAHAGTLPSVGGSYGTLVGPSDTGEIPALHVAQLERLLPTTLAASRRPHGGRASRCL